MKTFSALALLLLCAPPALAQQFREKDPEPKGPPAEPRLRAVKIAGALGKVTDLRQAPGDDTRLFVTSAKKGIYVIENGVVQPQLFLDMQSFVHQDQGIMSLAFHPDYPSNGRFFTMYMDQNQETQVVEYTVSADPNVADPNSARWILGPVPQPSPIHNWDCLQFGADGMLYVTTGDGVLVGDSVTNNAQDLGSILGKMLRLDIDAAPPFIPPDNPFVGVPGARGEIWHYGLRQPWRFCFDPVTNDLFIGDVGNGQREELNVIAGGTTPGLNFGWRCMEGTNCTNFHACNPMCNDPSWTAPIYEFPHDEFRCAIIGGYVYRGQAMPGLQGTYFFADYCTSRIFTFRYENGAMVDFTERTDELQPAGATLDLLSSFAVDNAGEIYFLDIPGGEVFKIEPAPPCVATRYCSGDTNSTGQGGRISLEGSLSVGDDDFTLAAEDCPPGQLGIFLYGPSQTSAPFGNGTLCVGNLQRLLPAAHLDASGTTSYAVDLAGANITAGALMNFQLWFRDPAAGGALFNSTDALHVGFCP